MGGFNTRSSTEDVLVFSKISINLPLLSANVEFILKVSNDLSWSLSCHGMLVEIDQCHAFTAVESRVSSAKALLQIIETLQLSQVCCGNAVSDFQSLVDARGASFKDATGIKQNIMSLLTNTYLHRD